MNLPLMRWPADLERLPQCPAAATMASSSFLLLGETDLCRLRPLLPLLWLRLPWWPRDGEREKCE